MQYILRVQDKKEKIKIIHDLADNFLFKVTNSTFSYRDRLPGANCGLARIFQEEEICLSTLNSKQRFLANGTISANKIIIDMQRTIFAPMSFNGGWNNQASKNDWKPDMPELLGYGIDV